MATNQFFIGRNPENIKFIQDIVSRVTPDARNKILDELDKTGTVGQDTLAQSGLPADVQQTFASQIDKFSKEDLSTQLNQQIESKQNVDVASLSDEELQNQIDLLTKRGQTPNNIDPATVNRAAVAKAKSYGAANPEALGGAIAYMANTKGQLPSVQDIIAKLGGEGTIIQTYGGEGLNFIKDQQARNDLADVITSQIKGTDYSTELSALKGTQATRADEAAKNTAVDQYLSGLKGELAKGTDQYIQAQQAASNDQLRNETLPTVAQNLNARGLLFSGDLPSEAGAAYTASQGNLESTYADMMSQDLAFFENAAYADQLKKSLVAGSDYASQLQAQEASALQDQQNRFSTAETKLSQQGKLDLARQAAETSVQNQQKLLQQQQDQANKAYEASLYGGLGSAGGAIIGAAVGGVPGAIAGSAVGGATGGSVGKYK